MVEHERTRGALTVWSRRETNRASAELRSAHVVSDAHLVANQLKQETELSAPVSPL